MGGGGVKNLPNKMPTEGGRGQKSAKLGDVFNGWSLMELLLNLPKCGGGGIVKGKKKCLFSLWSDLCRLCDYIRSINYQMIVENGLKLQMLKNL